MTALDAMLNILNSKNLSSYPFRYCLVDAEKHPMKANGEIAKPNCDDDFIEIGKLSEASLEQYRCLGISIHASNICAIDVDHCVEVAFDKNALNNVAKTIIEIFGKFAYIEFSFSGTGLRVLFKSKSISDYQSKFYTKNSSKHIEYYYPEGSARYVTLTGRSICDNPIIELNDEQQSTLLKFLNDNMQRNVIHETRAVIEDNSSLEQLMKKVKVLYFNDGNFQNLWFNPAPGSGHDESERDYHMVAYLYENVTQNKAKLKAIFEMSPFFKTKDWKHVNKWQKNDFRYFNYLYDRIAEKF